VSDPVKTTRRMMVAANAFEVLADGCGSLHVEEMSEILESEVKGESGHNYEVTPMLLRRSTDIANSHFQEWWSERDPRDLTIRYFHRGCEIATRKLHRCVPVAYGESERAVRDEDDRLLESLVIQPREIGRREHSVSFQHSARVRDITFKYGRDWLFGSANQHEWVGYCEGDGNSWIAFFNEHGGGFLYESREVDGSVVGQPLFFYREDVAREYARYVVSEWDRLVMADRSLSGASREWMRAQVKKVHADVQDNELDRVVDNVCQRCMTYAELEDVVGRCLVNSTRAQLRQELEALRNSLKRPEDADKQNDREALGKEVRAVWIGWAKEQPLVKPSWLAPWEELSESDREVDRRIGERLYSMGLAAKAPSTAS